MLDRYYLEKAKEISIKSTCLRRKVGAVLVRGSEPIFSATNGSALGCKSCVELQVCLRHELGIPSGHRHELCRAVHAEQRCIVYAARAGIPIIGSTLYCTDSPCAICSKLIIDSGIESVYFGSKYSDEFAFSLLNEAGIKIYCYKGDGVFEKV